MDVKIKALLVLAATMLLVAGLLFIPAGTLDYWQAWAFMGVLFSCISFILVYFLKNDPKLIERRLRFREKEKEQRSIISLAELILFLGFLVSGLDHRFGWSDVPSELSIAADALVLIGYCLVILVFRVNSYAARTIEVEKGQKVVATGPYSVIRHPMYLGNLIMFLAMPIALGSYVGIVPMLSIIPGIVLRIKNEEEVLLRELEGYREYCKKTKYRLIPFVW